MTPIKDPISTLNAFKFAKDGISFSRWESPDFQKMLDLSEEEISPFQRSSYLYKAEEILAKAVPVIPLFYQSEQAVIRKCFQVNSRPGSPDSFTQIKTIFKRR